MAPVEDSIRLLAETPTSHRLNEVPTTSEAVFVAPAHNYIPALDGMRAVSILLVLIAHAGLGNIVPGGFGVTLFFFISGYLITGQLLNEQQRSGTINFANFYLRRGLRLLPAAMVYIAAAGIFFILVGGSISLGGFLAAFFYGADFYEIFHAYYSAMPDIPHPFNILWSLAVEEQFYFIWPISILLLRRRDRILRALILVCILCFVWRGYLYPHCYSAHPAGICGVEPEWRLYKSLDTRLDSLAYGAIFAVLSLGPASANFARFIRRPDIRLLATLLLFASFLIRNAEFREIARYTCQGLALCILVPLALSEDKQLWGIPSKAWLSWAPAIFLGRLSYPLYLWHWAALGIAGWLLPQNHVGVVALWVLLTAGLAVLSWYGIERPMLRLRRRAGSHVPLDPTRPSLQTPPLPAAT